MTESAPADTTRISAVSAILAERLRSCRLRVASDRTSPPHDGAITPSPAIGLACHDALEVVAARTPLSDDGEAAVEAPFESSIGETAARPEVQLALWPDVAPERWPCYGIKRSRLLRAVRLLQSVIALSGLYRRRPESATYTLQTGGDIAVARGDT